MIRAFFRFYSGGLFFFFGDTEGCIYGDSVCWEKGKVDNSSRGCYACRVLVISFVELSFLGFSILNFRGYVG